jgi:hypothetical protein
MQINLNLSLRKIIFIVSALCVVVVSFFNIGFFVFLVLGAVGYHFIKPNVDEYLKSRRDNVDNEKLNKIVNKLSDEQRESLKRLLMED